MLENKVALVTGGTSGIGRATAIACAIVFAIEQPDDLDINEIVVRPIRQSG